MLSIVGEPELAWTQLVSCSAKIVSADRAFSNNHSTHHAAFIYCCSLGAVISDYLPLLFALKLPTAETQVHADSSSLK